MFGVKVLEERKSKYNGTLRVVRSLGLGIYIQANGLTQSGGVVESMWSQTLKHLSSIEYPISNILVLGLGGGTLVKLIKKHWPKSKISGVDIDPIIVELGKKHLKTDFENVDVKISDALTYVRGLSKSKKKFDLIIVDLYNGDQFPKKFEEDPFLRLIPKLLTDTGMVVFNRLYYKEKKQEAENFGQKLNEVFKNVESYKPVTNIMYICSN